jgi:hypothetical protein
MEEVSLRVSSSVVCLLTAMEEEEGECEEEKEEYDREDCSEKDDVGFGETRCSGRGG